jgi:putative ABC transport system substrate-binding protein
LIDAFQKGLRDLGYVEGQNITTHYHFASERGQTLEGAAAEVVSRAPEVIVTVGDATTTPAKRATKTIPIVFAPVGDPVRSGLVPSLALPGGNLTGVSLYAAELNEKRLEVFQEAFPHVRRVGALWNGNNFANALYWDDLRLAAERLRIDTRPFMTKGVSDLEARFADLTTQAVEGMIVITDAEFDAGREQIVRLARQNHLPTLYEHRAFVEAGGLISYGPDIDRASYRAAAYVDKLLKGAKPADLPIEQPTVFELLVNLKTANALGLTIPPTLLTRADEVIE